MTKQKCSHLHSENLIEDIFSCSTLFEKNSFHILDSSSLTYDTQIFEDKSFIEVSRILKESFHDNMTIIIKNLERFNLEFSKKCLSLGNFVDLHMYLNNSNKSSSFDFHSDSSDVLIHILYGEKKFELKINNKIETHILSFGDELIIPKGIEHKATNLSKCCSLSFGYNREQYYVPGGLLDSDIN